MGKNKPCGNNLASATTTTNHKLKNTGTVVLQPARGGAWGLVSWTFLGIVAAALDSSRCTRVARHQRVVRKRVARQYFLQSLKLYAHRCDKNQNHRDHRGVSSSWGLQGRKEGEGGGLKGEAVEGGFEAFERRASRA